MDRTKQLKKGYEELTSEKSYILGVLSGDASAPKNTITMNIKKSDLAFANALNDAFTTVYGIEGTIYDYGLMNDWSSEPLIHLQFHSINAKKDLMRYAKPNFKTKEWRVPDEVFDADEEIIYPFLRGHYDSDGTTCFIEIEGKYWLHAKDRSSNRDGMLDLIRLLEAVNFKTKMVPWTFDYKDQEKTMYEYSFTGKPAYDLLNTIKPALPRKRSPDFWAAHKVSDSFIPIRDIRSRYHFTKGELKEISRLFQEKTPITQIADIFNCGWWVIRNRLKKLGEV